MDNSNEIKDFLRNNMNKGELRNLEDDLMKTFTLGKRKSKKKVNNKRTKKMKRMTRQEKKALGLFHLPRCGTKYDDIKPMNNLWNDYMKEQLDSFVKIPLLHEKAWENFSLTLYKADYHGAQLTIVESKCTSLINITGICIMETKNTFKIICSDNIIRTIPKEGCAFILHYKDFDFKLYGKHINKKPAERSTKISKLLSLAEL